MTFEQILCRTWFYCVVPLVRYTVLLSTLIAGLVSVAVLTTAVVHFADHIPGHDCLLALHVPWNSS